MYSHVFASSHKTEQRWAKTIPEPICPVRLSASSGSIQVIALNIATVDRDPGGGRSDASPHSHPHRDPAAHFRI